MGKVLGFFMLFLGVLLAVGTFFDYNFPLLGELGNLIGFGLGVVLFLFGIYSLSRSR